MSGFTFEQLRLPVALVLIIVAAFVFLPRGQGGESAPSAPAAAGSVPTAGQPGGAVTSATTPATASPSASATPVPTPTPTPEPTDTPEPTATPVAQDGFSAEVLACRSISGSQCNGQLGTLPANASSFTALVRFTDANAGDQLNAVLDGPSGTIAGSPYALRGGGDGYFWAEFQVGGLPSGDYVVTALRNGEVVATTAFRRGGG